MASIPQDVADSYSSIIDDILRASDLNTISAKRIRKGLQESLGHDIPEEKEVIKALIMSRFDKFIGKQPENPQPEPLPSVDKQPANGVNVTSNGHAHKRTTSEESALSIVDEPPPKKKQKKPQQVEEDDAAFAARLQAEENLRGRARSTRGGNTKKRAPVQKKKKEKKKSANRIKDEDDSDIASGSGAEKKSPSRKGGFHKLMALSQPLTELLGESQLSRPQIVKKIWEYVKERDLQDPNDKRQIRCDDRMRAVFKQDRVHMFTMNKILNQNLYALDEIDGEV